MTIDITCKIAELLRQANPDLDARASYQAEALNENNCIENVIGNWIDFYDIKYLMSALALKDRDFASAFPEIRSLNRADRLELISVIESHLDQCTHCSLKRGYDFEIDSKIKSFCRENRDFLLQMLDEDADVTEGDHPAQNRNLTLKSKQKARGQIG